MKKLILTLQFCMAIVFANAQNEFITTWKTDNPGTSANNQITIPTFQGETYNYSVDWGDGTSNSGVTGNITHTYSSIGTYTVKVSGTFPRIYFNDTQYLQTWGDEEKILTVEEWGNNPWTSMDSAFAGCGNLQIMATDIPNLTNLTSLRRMFFWTGYPLNIPNIENWDVSNVTNLSGMFDKSSFYQDISAWDVSNVTDMSYLFFSCPFNFDISNWDVSNVTNMEGMFGSGGFRQDVTGWDVSSVTNMDFMFNSTFFDQDISSWDVSNVTSMRHMLSQCSFNQDISNWDIGQVADLSNIFDDNDLSRENYDKILIGWSQLPSLQNGVTLGANDAQFCLGKDARTFLASNYSWFISDQGENCEIERPFLTTWKTDNPGVSASNQITIPTNPREVYEYNVDWGDGTSDTNVTEDITHTYSAPGTYQVAITGRFPVIYFNSSENGQASPYKNADAKKILSVDQWGTNRWTSMFYSFAGCSNLNVTATDTPDFSRDVYLSGMFLDCTSLVGNKSFKEWDMRPITFMTSRMFAGATNFNQPIGNWDVRNVRYMTSMFEGATSFDQSLENWIVNKVENMDQMFTNSGFSTRNYDKTINNWAFLPALQSNVKLGAPNTSYCNSESPRQFLINNYNWVIDDAGKDCSKTDFITTWKTNNPGISEYNQITLPTVQGLNYNYSVDWGDGTTDSGVTSDITHTYSNPGTYTVSISGIFPRIYFNQADDPEKIISIDQWGNTKWTSMEWAFAWCKNLEVNAIDTPDLSDASSLTTMFVGCSSLQGNASMGSWDISSITSISSMFREAQNFNIDIGQWNTCNVTEMIAVFENASSFDQDISNWDVSNVNNMRAMFSKASSFNQNISGWDVGNVTDMTQMFIGATSFNQGINNWDVSMVTKMDAMFSGASSFDQDLSNWDVSKVTNMNVMFAGTPFNQDIGDWDLANVINIGGMFYEADSFNQDIGDWNVSNVTDTNSMFTGATSFDQDLGNWDISKVTDMSGMFTDAGMSTKNYDKLLLGWSNLASLQNGVYFAAGNNQYCDSEEARQNIIDTFGWTINDSGRDVNCNVDNDNDGVLDHLDLCLDTPAGESVDSDGCTELSANNFTIETIGETCPDSNNAKIVVESLVAGDFVARVNGNDYDFSTDLTIDNLAPGAYDLCIFRASQSFEQCFVLELLESNSASGKFSEHSGKATVVIDKGTAPYTIMVNGRTSFKTSSRTFDINISNGDLIEIQTAKVCEGSFSKMVDTRASIAYPNPTNGSFDINLPNFSSEAEIEIYTMQTRLISKRTYNVIKGKVSVNIENLPNGLYMVKVNSENPEIFKIVKQ